MGILSNIFGGVSNLIGQGLSYKGQKEANKANIQMQDSANRTNIDLAQGAREHDVAMWNRQNEYNTPQMQMQRLKDAGLNPNLIYDSGAGSAGNASAPQKSPVPSVQSAHVQNTMAQASALNLLPAIAQYQDWQVKKAQIDNIEAQTQATIDNNVGTQLKNYMLGIDRSNYQLRNSASLSKLRSEAQLANTKNLQADQEHLNYMQLQKEGANLDMSRYQLEGQKLTNRQKLLEIQLDENLKPHGMHRGDELWQRILLPHLLKGLNPVLNKAGSYLQKQFK